MLASLLVFFFFFNDTATTEIYTLSLHDALPISFMSNETGTITWLRTNRAGGSAAMYACAIGGGGNGVGAADRKSTRLNSSHLVISYAVFCLKKKKNAVAYALMSSARSYARSPSS